ncbi:MAG: DNA-directed polymerase subunit alpha [Campylobacterota bacterium]|nr:DNA-directed polymerase subunit alpha [Campylobacterota bacterium]
MKKIKTSPFVPNKYEIESIDGNHAKISISPFDIGYAITLAHPLKRIILSSTVGFAPTAVKIENASHEFDSIRGVLEDVAALIVNLKNIRFKIKDDFEKVKVDYSFKGPAELTGKSFNNDKVEVETPDNYFATINEDGALNISLIIEKGIGYVPSEDIRDVTEAGYLPLDAYFMPVKKANYTLEKVLVEDNPNFEKIVFDIVTDGQVEPTKVFDDAVKTMFRQLEVFGMKFKPQQSSKSTISKEHDEILKKLLMKIEEINLSARSHNCLTRSEIKFVGELVLMSEAELARVKNLGKKSLDEIKQSLIDMGVGAGEPLPNEIVEIFQQKVAEMKG